MLKFIKTSPIVPLLISNSFWSLLSSVVMRGHLFLIGIILARILGAELYGQFVFLRSTIQLLETAVGISFGLAISRYITTDIPKFKKNDVIFTNFLVSFLLSLIVSSCFYIFSESISASLFSDVAHAHLIQLSVFYILFSNMFHTLIGILKGEQKFKVVFVGNAIVAVLNILVTISLAYYFSLKGAVISLVIFSIMQLCILLYFTCNFSSFLLAINLKKLKLDLPSLKHFSFPLLLSGLAAPLAIWFLNVLIAGYNEGFKELSYFNSAYQVFAIIIFIPIALSDAMYPILNKYVGTKKFVKLVTFCFLVVLGISSFLSMLVFMFSEDIMGIYGSDFVVGSKYLEILAVAAIFSSLLTFLGRVVISLGAAWANLTFNLFWGGLVVLLSCFLLKQYIVGVAVSLAFVISYMLLFTVQLVYIIKLLNNNQRTTLTKRDVN